MIVLIWMILIAVAIVICIAPWLATGILCGVIFWIVCEVIDAYRATRKEPSKDLPSVTPHLRVVDNEEDPF